MKKSTSTTLSGTTTPQKAKVPNIKLKSLNSTALNSSRNSMARDRAMDSMRSSFSSRSSIISIAESDQNALNTSSMGPSDNAVFIKFKIKIMKIDMITNDPLQIQIKMVDQTNMFMDTTTQMIQVDKLNPSAKFNEYFTVVLQLNKQMSTKSKGDMYSYKYFEKRIQFKAQYQKKNTGVLKSIAYGTLDMSQYVTNQEAIIKQPFKKYGIKNIQGKAIFMIQAFATDQMEQSIQNTTDELPTQDDIKQVAVDSKKESVTSSPSPFAPKGDDLMENDSILPVKTQLIDLNNMEPTKQESFTEQKEAQQQQLNQQDTPAIQDQSSNNQSAEPRIEESVKVEQLLKTPQNAKIGQINLSSAHTQRKSTLTTNNDKLSMSSGGAKTMTNRGRIRSSYAFNGGSAVPHSNVDLQSEEDDQQLLQQFNDPNKMEELRQQRIKFLNSHISQPTKNQTNRSMSKSDSKSNKSGKSGNRVSFNRQFSASQQQVENDSVYIQLIEDCLKSMNEEVIWLQQQNKQQKDKLINFQLQEESFNEMKQQQEGFKKEIAQKEKLEEMVEQLQQDMQQANELTYQQEQSIMDLETQVNDQKTQLRSVAMMQNDAGPLQDNNEESENTDDISVLRKQLESYKEENQKLKNIAGSYEVQLVNSKRQLAQIMNDIIQEEKTPVRQPSTPRQRNNFFWP